INIGPDQSFKNINVAQGGSILIGFAHLDSIAAEVVPGAALPTGTIIGISGKTGGDYIPHLDVSAFYVPDNPRAIRMDSLPPIPDYLAPDGRPFEYSYNAYFTMYDLTRDRPEDAFGEPSVINPLVLWPSLQEG